ncbi:hypothetical protein N7510_008978 [Penicillium lagena]|uniref:uncharacterized protein n=1 Tax=Penicillium lagena TaxID=94218 RepID=UPI002541AC7F|nr:uncharacterized protein N7510_008978 [Penicillium lagena]KAJ5606197.1 hypothetical protein N7510_008978 [Penicillium lagena]
MPTFAYWRRDQRRSAVPPAPPLPIPPPTSSKGGNESPVGSPLQLPALPDTPILTRTLGDAPFIDVPPPPTSDSRLETDTAKLDITTSTTALSSSFSPAAPSPFTETEHRPHSSSGPGERDREPALISSDYSQLPFPSPSPQQDQASEGEPNSKPNSPFRRSFVGGKGLRTLQAQPVDTQKRSPTAAAGNTGHFRFRASPDESSPDKQNMQKEFKAEGVGAVARRAGDRDISADHTHHKSGKAMLHLLNPMSLLARRRSSQVPGSRTDDANIGAQNLVPAIPDDYDPRIRGNIVHDFSAPRPRRNLSGPDANTQSAHEPSPSQSGGPDPKSPWSDHQKRLSDHSPVFKEHFEDDQNVLQVENKAWLREVDTRFCKEASVSTPRPKRRHRQPPDSEPASDSPKKTSPPPADTQDQDQDTIPYVPSQLSGLPKHFKSNASRFSFDMNGVESSVQEKLLEEKHKEKAAARRLEQSFFDDFDDDFDNEILDDVDGLEERIPGVNADADDDDDDDDYNTLSVSRDVNGEVKSWAVPGLSPVAASPITPAAPQPSQFASYQYEDSPFGGNATQQSQQVPPESSETKRQGHFSMSSNPAQTLEDDDDDLYFDDGDFGDLTLAGDDENKVDESIFDDESNHLFAPNPAGEHVVPIPSTDDGKLRRNDSVAKESVVEEDGNPGLKHMPSVASDYRVTASIKRGPLGEPIPNMGPTRGHGGVLTEQNLEVLHHALAFAANEAATKSRFERTFSVSEKSIGRDSVSGASQTGEPGLMSDDSRLSQAADIMTYEDAFEDLIYDDDALYDDPIVAAANAEALENDDEGFYGQEFGFYAQAHGACDSDSELTNGGYFGPRGVDGISRSHSGGGKFQEPSLTPITERSEWSTRNSMISLKAHGAGHSNASLASPGLAQLVDMGNLDDEMSLSALMKLRRGAWGGSNGSLRSSAGSPPPHTLTSSNRGSFIAASEASPTVSDVRPFSTDDGLSAGGHTSERPSTEAF